MLIQQTRLVHSMDIVIPRIFSKHITPTNVSGYDVVESRDRIANDAVYSSYPRECS